MNANARRINSRASERGWSSRYHGYARGKDDPRNPPRHCYSWNPKEDHDLMHGYRSGMSERELAGYHGRSDESVRQRILILSRLKDGEAAPSEDTSAEALHSRAAAAVDAYASTVPTKAVYETSAHVLGVSRAVSDRAHELNLLLCVFRGSSFTGDGVGHRVACAVHDGLLTQSELAPNRYLLSLTERGLDRVMLALGLPEMVITAEVPKRPSIVQSDLARSGFVIEEGPFYLVTSDMVTAEKPVAAGVRRHRLVAPPSVVQATETQAMGEAERFARNTPGTSFYVLKAVRRVQYPVVKPAVNTVQY